MKKITSGQVEQEFDSLGKLVSQRFIAGGEVEWEGNESDTCRRIVYHPFDMVQPIYHLSKPLSKEELLASRDSDGFITAVIPVDMNDLLDGDIESLNNLADELILGPESPSYLGDMSYKVVGIGPVDSILIEVTACVEMEEE